MRFRVDPLYLIAAFKICKGLLLLAVALGVLGVLRRGAGEELYRWAESFRVDPSNRFMHLVLARILLLSPRQLEELDAGTFFYAAIFFSEGLGLAWRKRWAEYFTIVVTCSFVPLEVYELTRRATFSRALVLVLNLAAVVYLVFDLRRAAGSRELAPGDDRTGKRSG